MRRSQLLVLVTVIGCAFDSSGAVSGDGTGVGESGATTTDATSNPTTSVSTSTASSTATTTVGPSTSDPDTTATDTATTTVDPSTESDATQGESTGPASPCDTDNGGCDHDATCSDMDGGIKCTCNPGFVGDGLACATTPEFPILRTDMPCTGGECYGPATCYTDVEVIDSVVMSGEAGIVYDVTLAVRGVLEQKEYDGDCDGLWCVGGEPDTGPWNSVTIAVSDPLGIYYPNAGQAGLYEVFEIDYERTIPIAAGATITVTMDGFDDCTINNDVGLVIPGIPPAPEPFDGQFLQLDLLDATIAG